MVSQAISTNFTFYSTVARAARINYSFTNPAPTFTRASTAAAIIAVGKNSMEKLRISTAASQRAAASITSETQKITAGCPFLNTPFTIGTIIALIRPTTTATIRIVSHWVPPKVIFINGRKDNSHRITALKIQAISILIKKPPKFGYRQ